MGNGGSEVETAGYPAGGRETFCRMSGFGAGVGGGGTFPAQVPRSSDVGGGPEGGNVISAEVPVDSQLSPGLFFYWQNTLALKPLARPRRTSRTPTTPTDICRIGTAATEAFIVLKIITFSSNISRAYR